MGLNNTLKEAEDYIKKDLTYGAHNYKQLPVVLKRGEGIYLYDIKDKRYYDFTSTYSSTNQGNCHPEISSAMVEQCKRLTVCSRTFHNNILGECEQFLANLFKYDKVLMMNSGAEAAETAFKICRKWGYEVKKIPTDSAKIIFCNNNFCGRTLACISASTNIKSTKNFGPFIPNFVKIPYNNLEELESELKDPNVCAFVVEPVQGEAGVIIPSENYLKDASALCNKYNVLFVADEIQTGLGRTGALLACHRYNVKPDILILGKALSGGFYPISAVLANDDIMLVLKPGEHGSTYGGNPLAAAICSKAVQVILKEKLPENSKEVGDYFIKILKKELAKSKIVREIRGIGLFCAIEVINDLVDPWDICLKLLENGLLTAPVHEKTIRLTPPLCITKEQITECANIISKVIKSFETKEQ